MCRFLIELSFNVDKNTLSTILRNFLGSSSLKTIRTNLINQLEQKNKLGIYLEQGLSNSFIIDSFNTIGFKNLERTLVFLYLTIHTPYKKFQSYPLLNPQDLRLFL